MLQMLLTLHLQHQLKNLKLLTELLPQLQKMTLIPALQISLLDAALKFIRPAVDTMIHIPWNDRPGYCQVYQT